MKSLRRATGILWIVGGALIGLVYAINAQDDRAHVQWIAAIAYLAIVIGHLGSGFLLRRKPLILVGFVVAAVGWLLLALAAVVTADVFTLGQILAAVGSVVWAIGALLAKRSRVVLVALAAASVLYLYVSGGAATFTILLLAAVLVVTGVVTARRGFVGR